MTGAWAAGGHAPRIGYLVHDLSDPAVARRVTMFTAGGAKVAVAGLSRGAHALPGALDLGKSEDARLMNRILRLGWIAASQKARIAAHLAGCRVIVARNLEMLALAVRLLPAFPQRPRLVYECLDIHRLLVGDGPASAALRRLERALAPHVDLVLTSSPAFVTHHLGAVFGDRIALVENRALDLDGGQPAPEGPPPGPPWRIGWFGALRCAASLRILTQACELANGGLDVLIRGRPSPAIFPDLSAQVQGTAHLHFAGPYGRDDIGALYAQVHFAWCIDLYEAGANSEWLLPNRLYEGLGAGAVPIALARTEAGRLLARHGIGVLLDDVRPATVVAALGAMDAGRFGALLQRQRALPRRMWWADRQDCRTLVGLIADLTEVAR